MTAAQVNLILSEIGESSGVISSFKTLVSFGHDTDHVCYTSPEKKWMFDSSHELIFEYLYDKEKDSTRLLAIYPYETLYFIRVNEKN